MLKAKCRGCEWKVKASGEKYLMIAVQAHEGNTGHKVDLPLTVT